MAVSETWLRSSDNSNDFLIQNYCLLRCDRSIESRGGCVAIYVNTSLSFASVDFASQCTPNNHNIDIMGVKIVLCRKSLIILAVYRPPRVSFSLFLNYLENCLAIAFVGANLVVCLGDFNINLLNVIDVNIYTVYIT